MKLGSRLNVYIYFEKIFTLRLSKLKVKTKGNDYLRRIGNYFGALLPEI